MKYIVITGGVVSGLGKGISASSIGAILKASGVHVTMVKIDPYINVDAGTMSPYEHGEVFVLNDGAETDLDLGNYERFLDISLSAEHNITTGKVYKSVIDAERRGAYLGQTVQVIPHITNKIHEFIQKAAHLPINGTPPDVCIIEVGGTVGDIESMVFIEALRQLSYQIPKEDMCFVHVSLVGKIGICDEVKTKPTQNSIKDLRQLGLHPDLLIVRSDGEITPAAKQKLSMFCHVPERNIIINGNVKSIYQVPLLLHSQHIGDIIRDKLALALSESNGASFANFAHFTDFDRYLGAPELAAITIGIVGKYTEFADAYLSVTNAIQHAAFRQNCRVTVKWLSAENVDRGMVSSCDGIIIPGGFGHRGIEGMISVAAHCREHGIPLLGICLGMHVICIEAARQLYGPSCNSAEFDPETPHKVVTIIDDTTQALGGTMKLGLHDTKIEPVAEPSGHTLAYQLYRKTRIQERHRHRFEINPEYVAPLTVSGKLRFSGVNEKSVDIAEHPGHRFYIGCQFHPEFLSTLLKPAPLFVGLIAACLAERRLSENRDQPPK